MQPISAKVIHIIALFLNAVVALALTVETTRANGLLNPAPATGAYWWYSRGVLIAGNTPDDYAGINQGQLKNFVKQARQELQDNLPGGAGPALNNLVDAWATPTTHTDDFAGVNLGQLKSVVQLIYDRLIATGHADGYPWTDSALPSDDFALANIGQVKNLLNFDIAHPKLLAASGQFAVMIDAVTATSYELWLAQYPGLTQKGYWDNPSGDGISNLMKYALGLNPTQNSTVSLPAIDIVNYQGLNYLALKFDWPQTIRSDLVYTLEASSNLSQPWSQITNPVTIYADPPQPGLAAGYRRVKMLDNIPFGTYALRFLRLRISFSETADSDGDGVGNQDEIHAALDPFKKTDSDGDNMADDFETYYFGNITGRNGNDDFDGDTKSDLQEYLTGRRPNTSILYGTVKYVWEREDATTRTVVFRDEKNTETGNEFGNAIVATYSDDTLSKITALSLYCEDGNNETAAFKTSSNFQNFLNGTFDPMPSPTVVYEIAANPDGTNGLNFTGYTVVERTGKDLLRKIDGKPYRQASVPYATRVASYAAITSLPLTAVNITRFPAILRDFPYGSPEYPDFGFHYALGTVDNLIQSSLAPDPNTYHRLPVFADPNDYPNTDIILNAGSFHEWYTKPDAVTLTVGPNANHTFENGLSAGTNDSDLLLLQANDVGKTYGRFAFTLELHMKLDYDLNEGPASTDLKLYGDDSTWVFINGKLALGGGGTPSRRATLSELLLNNSELAAVLPTPKGRCDVAIFNAEQHTSNSSLQFETNSALRPVYAYQVVVDTSPNLTPSYALTAAPSGMTIGSTGKIFWDYSNVGSGNYPVSVAVNAGGEILNQSFVISVDNAPVFFRQPISQTVKKGDTAILVADAMGPGLTYQWFFGSTAIPGATSSTLTLANVQSANAGDYFLRVTNIGGESADSNVAHLTVNRLTSIWFGTVEYSWMAEDTAQQTIILSDHEKENTLVARYSDNTLATITRLQLYNDQNPSSIIADLQLFLAGNLDPMPSPTVEYNMAAPTNGAHTLIFSGYTVGARTGRDLLRKIDGQPYKYETTPFAKRVAATAAITSLPITTLDVVHFPAILRDFPYNSPLYPDFGRTYWAYQVTDLLESQLAPDAITYRRLPVFAHSDDSGNRPITNAASFQKWYTKPDALSVTLGHGEDSSGTPFPWQSGLRGINEGDIRRLQANDVGSNDGQLCFTQEVHLKLDYNLQAGPNATELYVEGDDSTWVFINGKLVFDGGGLHSSRNLLSNLPHDLTGAQGTCDVAIFYAEQHSSAAVIKLQSNSPIRPVYAYQVILDAIPPGFNPNYSITTVPSTLGMTIGATGKVFWDYSSVPSGSYPVSIQVALGNGTTLTQDFVLSVNNGPGFSIQPKNQTIPTNESATLTAEAFGQGFAPVTYQWFKGVTALTGQVSNTLTFTNAQPAAAGGYSVKATSVTGQVTSSNVVAFTVVPVFTAGDYYVECPVGETATIATETIGSGITYQWFRKETNPDGSSYFTPLAGETSKTLTLTNVQYMNSGEYRVVASNPHNVDPAAAGATAYWDTYLHVY